MEDILASIKRIIAEDSEVVAQRSPRVRKGPVAVPDLPPVPASEGEDRGPIDADQPEPPAPADEAHDSAPSDDTEAEPEEPADVLELTSPIPEPIYEEVRMAVAAEVQQQSPPAESILSGAAANASRSAFAALTQLQVRAEAGRENTLEGLVADLLRPMLREYLDRELPGLVERLVAAEIQRVSGRN